MKKGFLGMIMVLTIMFSLIGSINVMAADPYTYDYDFSTAGGASAFSAIGSFDSSKNALLVNKSSSVSFYFSSVDMTENLRVTEYVFEPVNLSGTFMMLYRGGPMWVLGYTNNTSYLHMGASTISDTNYKLTPGHKYFVRSAYNNNTKEIKNYVKDFMDGSEYNGLQRYTDPISYTGYKISATSANLYLYSFKSYEEKIPEVLDYDFSTATMDSHFTKTGEAGISDYNGENALYLPVSSSVNFYPISTEEAVSDKIVNFETSVTMADTTTSFAIQGQFGSELRTIFKFYMGDIYVGDITNSNNILCEYEAGKEYKLTSKIDLLNMLNDISITYVETGEVLGEVLKNVSSTELTRIKFSASATSGNECLGAYINTLKMDFKDARSITLLVYSTTGIQIKKGDSATLKVTDNNGNTPVMVEFYDNATLLGTVYSTPYKMTLSNLEEKTYLLKAIAYYEDGSVANDDCELKVSGIEKTTWCTKENMILAPTLTLDEYGKRIDSLSNKNIAFSVAEKITESYDQILVSYDHTVTSIEKGEYAGLTLRYSPLGSIINLPMVKTGMVSGHFTIAGADVTPVCEANKTYQVDVLMTLSTGLMNVKISDGSELIYLGKDLTLVTGGITGFIGFKLQQDTNVSENSGILTVSSFTASTPKYNIAPYVTESMKIMQDGCPLNNLSELSPDFAPLYLVDVTNNTLADKTITLVIASYDANSLTNCYIKKDQMLIAGSTTELIVDNFKTLKQTAKIKAFVVENDDTLLNIAAKQLVY